MTVEGRPTSKIPRERGSDDGGESAAGPRSASKVALVCAGNADSRLLTEWRTLFKVAPSAGNNAGETARPPSNIPRERGSDDGGEWRLLSKVALSAGDNDGEVAHTKDSALGFKVNPVG